MVKEDLKCYHCGQPCEGNQFAQEDKSFCCYGCQVVYEIIHDNDLCQYYSFENHPGMATKPVAEDAYKYLEDGVIQQQLLEFKSVEFARIRFFIPAIHCVSCIWLLENLRKLEHGILRSEVNFSKKSVFVDFHPERVTLSRIAQLLASLGYAPQIQLSSAGAEAPTGTKPLLIRLTVAGFCFGNVMLFSFPEYLGLDQHDEALRHVFSWLNIALSIPVLVFSAKDFFHSAWKSFAQKQINIDVPIAVGLVALFSRSVWDILTGFGPGYLDSFTGLVFFLLIGRWFQGKTYESLAFDRDFKSYFPLAIQKWVDSDWKPVIIYELRKGDQIRVRNLEIIPTDCLLVDKEAFIDYSFVTGESRPVRAKPGDLAYAGGRLIGQPSIFTVEKQTSQSYLTSLWNHESFRKRKGNSYQRKIDRAAKVFTWLILTIAFFTAVYWYAFNPDQMWLILTSVLMVACPCALALAAPFTYGSMLRAFGRNGLYLKNADVIERLSSIEAVVFDKTGTVTHGGNPEVFFEGTCTAEELAAIKQLTSFSTHPLSNLITTSIRVMVAAEIIQFKELPGKGIEGQIGSHWYAIGSAKFVGLGQAYMNPQSRVFVAIDHEQRGFFSVRTSTRHGMKEMISELGKRCVALLSGDNEGDRESMQRIFGTERELCFNQSPHEKRAYIEALQLKGMSVLMVGDGLNDAGALKQSDVGISVSDDTGVFTPSCDGILRGEKVSNLDRYLRLARRSTGILRASFVISFFYNTITLTFAISGNLTPLIAAVLMPISSISVVFFASLAVRVAARREKLT